MQYSVHLKFTHHISQVCEKAVQSTQVKACTALLWSLHLIGVSVLFSMAVYLHEEGKARGNVMMLCVPGWLNAALAVRFEVKNGNATCIEADLSANFTITYTASNGTVCVHTHRI